MLTIFQINDVAIAFLQALLKLVIASGSSIDAVSGGNKIRAQFAEANSKYSLYTVSVNG